MSKKIIKLTESDLHNIIKKSVYNILREDNEYNDDWYDWEDDEDYGSDGEICFRWVIYCDDDKIAESSQTFPNENEAAADCEKHFEETNFYLLCQKLNDDENDDRVCAIVCDCNPDSDTYLQNLGWGWMD